MIAPDAAPCTGCARPCGPGHSHCLASAVALVRVDGGTPATYAVHAPALVQADMRGMSVQQMGAVFHVADALRRATGDQVIRAEHLAAARARCGGPA